MGETQAKRSFCCACPWELGVAMAPTKTPFSGLSLNIQLAVTMLHMMSMTALIPGMWNYLKEMGATVNYIGWGMAAFPFGAWVAARYLRDCPLGPIKMISRPEADADNSKGRVKRTVKGKPWTKSMFALLMIVAAAGNIVYAFGQRPEVILAGRVLAGMGSSAALLTHKFVEFSTGGDEVMVRSRMVMLGATQAAGAVAGVVLAVVVGMLPSVRISGFDKEFSSQPLAAITIAVLYVILLPGVWMTYDSIMPKKDAIDYVDQHKGEIDAPPSNYMSAQRFGILVPAVVYDRGQARPTSLPDVFSTAVVLVVYFFTNNLMVGVEVAHGPICAELFQWQSVDIAITYLAFLVAGIIGLMLSLSLSDEVPCNRRVFGALVLMFVTYGLMLQPHTPKEQYIAFLVVIGACYYVTDIAMTEIHVDKIGEEEDARMTASHKHMVMGWLNSTASFTRIFSSIITGYIYAYYSEAGQLARRPYAVYGCAFGVCMLLVMMTIIFYKRFQFRSLENQIVPPDKMPLQPQVINCIDEA